MRSLIEKEDVKHFAKALPKIDYTEVDVRRALKSAGHVLVKMPDFDKKYLKSCKDGTVTKREEWRVILDEGKASCEFYKRR